MIVPMKKVTVICLADDRETALDRLRTAGLLHVSERHAEENELASVQKALETAKTALALLKHDSEGHATAEDNRHASEAGAVINRVIEIHERQSEIGEATNGLHKLIETYAPFGSFSPEKANKLAEEGFPTRLLTVPNDVALPQPENGLCQVITQEKSLRYVALIGEHELPEHAREVALPAIGLEEAGQQAAVLQQEHEALHREQKALSVNIPAIEAEISRRENALEFEKVRASMQQDRAVRFIEGFVPEDATDAMTKMAKRNSFAIRVTDPTDEASIPTLIRTPRWVKPIKAVFNMLGITPGYHEADTSMVFMIFFSFFFAMLIGDAGYGLLFLLSTLFARKKLPDAPSYPFTLLYILSIGTILWGVVNATYFGIRPAANGSPWPGQVAWLSKQENVMWLCFMIGAVQLSIAHLWNAVVLFPQRKAFAQIGWMGIVVSTFTAACNMVLQVPYPSWVLPVFIAGLLLVILFMTDPKALKTQWINHAMLPLSVINSMVDIISYIRLFAVGMASVSVASSFNDMATGIELPLPLKIPVMALILLLGHGLNIVLGALAILVHAVRLNTLEFSQHKGLEWSGITYKPFGKTNRG